MWDKRTAHGAAIGFIILLGVLRCGEFLMDYLFGNKDGEVTVGVFATALPVMYWSIIVVIVYLTIFSVGIFFHRRHQQKIVYLMLLSTSVLSLLVCMEFGVRQLFPGKYVYFSNFTDRPIINFGPYGSMLASDFSDTLHGYRVYTVNSPLVPWQVTTNKHGWREPGYYEEMKTQGNKRLMVLGDSVTYGMTLDYQYIHSSYLNHALRLDPQNNWEVLNRSVPGWNAWHEREYFRLDGIRWKPDVVTVNVVMNDFKPVADAEYLAAVPKPPLFYKFFGKSKLYNFARIAFMKPPKPSEVLEFYRGAYSTADHGLWNRDKWWFIRGEYDTPEKEAFYQKAKDLSYPRYLEIKQECDRIGAYCLVVVYPTASQTSLKYWMRTKQSEAILQVRAINEFCEYLKDNNVPYVNLVDAFRRETVHALFVDESHLTEYGHRISAIEVLKHLRENNVVNLYDLPLWD